MSGEFEDREAAGNQLAANLAVLRFAENVMVLGIPRGGVPVAAAVAAQLHLPLDVVIVRKLGLPNQPEVAMGAIGEGGVRVLDHELIIAAGAAEAATRSVERTEQTNLAERVRILRSGVAPPDLTGRTALIIDDGLATGATAIAACQVARLLGAAQVIVAAPVGGSHAVQRVLAKCEVVCPLQPLDFRAVGLHYRNFTQTPESDVIALLAAAHLRTAGERP